ncbi:hypothetical protein CPB84DRAFT_1764786 [Gymnopilus junonius]|uniref:Uncharacterized protein n=1 Tax=Gymnopilus junonius TaxID=109634 RepID=A0A9P5NXZ9_GYMJU|nr:hypothetical protein CPB84DRAFT_1764786 [Gymnopilus junonius]
MTEWTFWQCSVPFPIFPSFFSFFLCWYAFFLYSRQSTFVSFSPYESWAFDAHIFDIQPSIYHSQHRPKSSHAFFFFFFFFSQRLNRLLQATWCFPRFLAILHVTFPSSILAVIPIPHPSTAHHVFPNHVHAKHPPQNKLVFNNQSHSSPSFDVKLPY